MADENQPQRYSIRKTFRRRAERDVDRELHLQHLRQRLHEGLHRDGNESDSSGNADSGDEPVESSQSEDEAQEILFDGREDGAVEHEDEEHGDEEQEMIVDDARENQVPLHGDGIIIDRSDTDSDAIGDSDSDEEAEDGRQLVVENMTAEVKEAYLKQSLKEWSSSGGVLSMRKVDELLGKVSYVFRSVPKSYKTLLETTQDIQINVADDHKMWYKGIKANLDQMVLDGYIRLHGRITIDVNMDGLPLDKDSNSKKFWPILGKLVGAEDDPFEIAIYYGNTDPRDVDLFLGDFIVEVRELTQNGYEHSGVVVPFVIRNFILDAPARSLIKCCIGHGGYGACEKCCVVGEYAEGRIHFATVPVDCRKRSDHSYREKSDRLHHVGRSPLEFLNIGMVSQFRLDTMHLVYKGVFLRLLEATITWQGDWNPGAATLRAISARLLNLVQSCPRDFNRKPRKIEDYYKYKATELRRLLLYDGVLVFKDQFSDEMYSLFLLLHSAIYIQSSSYLLPTWGNHAREFIQSFVQYSSEIFGLHFVVYNVHSLTHLADECVDNGNLESFSAFVYENRLKTIKQTLRSGYQPLEQIIKRDSERRERREVKLKSQENTVELFQPIQGNQFQRISINGVVFKVKSKDGCFMTYNGSVVLLQNIMQRDGNNIVFCGKRFVNRDNVYTYPINSGDLGIWKVWGLSDDIERFPLEEIFCKCWLMSCEDTYVSTPLSHSTPLLH